MKVTIQRNKRTLSVASKFVSTKLQKKSRKANVPVKKGENIRDGI